MTAATQSAADLRVDIRVHRRAVDDAFRKAGDANVRDDQDEARCYLGQWAAMAKHLRDLEDQLAEAEAA